MGNTRGHLHERVEGHTRKASSIYIHYNLQHNNEMSERFIEQLVQQNGERIVGFVVKAPNLVQL